MYLACAAGFAAYLVGWMQFHAVLLGLFRTQGQPLAISPESCLAKLKGSNWIIVAVVSTRAANFGANSPRAMIRETKVCLPVRIVTKPSAVTRWSFKLFNNQRLWFNAVFASKTQWQRLFFYPPDVVVVATLAGFAAFVKSVKTGTA